MRFAMTATDRYLGVFESFIQAGWTPLKLFTSMGDNRMFQNREVIERAQRLNIPVQLSRIQEGDLRELKNTSCDVLIVASYAWRIVGWEQYLPYAVNFHPSPLPYGRGPYPAVRAILDRWEYWGMSCHQVAPEFDSGNLLGRECFPMDAAECHESLDLKLQLAGSKLAKTVANDFVSLWDGAAPQGSDGSYWSLFTDADRTLDFKQPVEDILRRARAFGEHECFAMVNDARLFIRRIVAWRETHDQTPGRVVLNNGLRFVVAALDGYVGILEWSLVAPGFIVGRNGR